MVESSGTLLFRKSPLEVLLVHPSGSYNKDSPWSIPKGQLDKDETPEEAARRETLEETGVVTPENIISLGHVVYPHNKKKVYCFAGEVKECEPSCASWEIDEAKFFPIEEARKIIHQPQLVFLERLVALQP